MECTNPSPNDGSVCNGTVVSTDCFPRPDELSMRNWAAFCGKMILDAATANPNTLICIKCGHIYPPPEEETLVWDWEVCPI